VPPSDAAALFHDAVEVAIGSFVLSIFQGEQPNLRAIMVFEEDAMKQRGNFP
jgi:hypothetical protein